VREIGVNTGLPGRKAAPERFKRNMAKKREWTKSTRGSQLITPGDIITLMENGTPLTCRVLACLAMEEGRCGASLEVVEGDRKGERIKSIIRADSSHRTEDG
jgi:hypothetical protein